MNRKPRILVVGSFVMDLITSTRVFPGPGETVLGETFTTAPGGKGANQAVQAARLGADVTMVGKVGRDAFGQALTGSMQGAGVHTEHVALDERAPSSIGNITLERFPDGSSRNRIIVVPGANMTITPEDIAFLEKEIASFDMVMLQFEIPMDIDVRVARLAQKAGVPVMVNPAPAAPIPEALMAWATYLSPNEHEAAAITGIPIRVEGGVNLQDVQAVADALRARGARNLLVTLGENGAAIAGEGGVTHVPSVPDVAVADPTAAGDSFVAAFCTGVCAGLDPRQAIDFARNTAAITVSRMGAQPSLPTLDEVIAAMQAHAEPGFDFAKLDCLR